MNNNCPNKGSRGIVFTACSKSADMPIDSLHCSSGIPSALQTSVLQFDNVWRQKTFKKLEEHTEKDLIAEPCITCR